MKARETEKLIRRFISPVMNSYIVKGRSLYSIPIQYVLRGFDFGYAEGKSETFIINAFVMYLYRHETGEYFDYSLPVTITKPDVQDIISGRKRGGNRWVFDEKTLPDIMPSILTKNIRS